MPRLSVVKYDTIVNMTARGIWTPGLSTDPDFPGNAEVARRHGRLRPDNAAAHGVAEQTISLSDHA